MSEQTVFDWLEQHAERAKDTEYDQTESGPIADYDRVILEQRGAIDTITIQAHNRNIAYFTFSFHSRQFPYVIEDGRILLDRPTGYPMTIIAQTIKELYLNLVHNGCSNVRVDEDCSGFDIEITAEREFKDFEEFDDWMQYYWDKPWQ